MILAKGNTLDTDLHITEENHGNHPDGPLHSLLCMKEKAKYKYF